MERWKSNTVVSLYADLHCLNLVIIPIFFANLLLICLIWSPQCKCQSIYTPRYFIWLLMSFTFILPLKETHTVSYGTALTWTLLLPVWKVFTSTRNQIYGSATLRNTLQSYLVFYSILDLFTRNLFMSKLLFILLHYFIIFG